jgi:hypothetical protein
MIEKRFASRSRSHRQQKSQHPFKSFILYEIKMSSEQSSSDTSTEKPSSSSSSSVVDIPTVSKDEINQWKEQIALEGI